jgi:hypothetical protein
MFSNFYYPQSVSHYLEIGGTSFNFEDLFRFALYQNPYFHPIHWSTIQLLSFVVNTAFGLSCPLLLRPSMQLWNFILHLAASINWTLHFLVCLILELKCFSLSWWNYFLLTTYVRISWFSSQFSLFHYFYSWYVVWIMKSDSELWKILILHHSYMAIFFYLPFFIHFEFPLFLNVWAYFWRVKICVVTAQAGPKMKMAITLQITLMIFW